MLWLWILLSLAGVIVYANIGYSIGKYLEEKHDDRTGILGGVSGIFWPLTLMFLSIARLAPKLFFAPKIINAVKEMKAAKKQKLLEAHTIDPLQEELDRFQEIKRMISIREYELILLTKERDVLEAKRAGTYREPAIVEAHVESEEDAIKANTPIGMLREHPWGD